MHSYVESFVRLFVATDTPIETDDIRIFTPGPETVETCSRTIAVPSYGEAEIVACDGGTTEMMGTTWTSGRRTSFRAKRVYVNGPYVRRYWLDGSIVKSKYVKKDKDLRRNLPKTVWLAFKDFLDRPENEE